MQVRQVGARALLLEFEPGDGEPLACVAAWRTAVSDLVDRGELARPDDVVPGARTLLVDGIAASDADRLARLDGLRSGLRPGPLVEVPTVYDGEDLAEVARLWGVTPDEAVTRHAGTAFTVAFCGFAPGFPYLVGMDGEVPRRASPRPSVPAGSVALAGRYCGIYPAASPGGWQLLGRTTVPLFDPDRDPPALLPPGTRVRFVPVPSLPAVLPARPARTTADRALTVVRPGALTTVQDAGRPGLAEVGVTRSGALDAAAARLANRLVGNAEDAAVLETTVDGVALQASAPMTVAVTGAGALVRVAGRPVDLGLSVGVGAGEALDVGAAVTGLRSYVAVAGGVDVAPVLGSRSTDTLSGLGPAPLRAGDVLPVGRAGPIPAVDLTLPSAVATTLTLGIRLGPREDWFGEAGLTALLGGAFTVSPLSNRIGARLLGPPVPRAVQGELESEGMVLGAVQVPPDGSPVVLLADHPTTGGYPVIGVVDPDGVAALAQARPGTPVHFVRRTP